jgi:cell division protein FtsI (penicillin-binding protein 3)
MRKLEGSFRESRDMRNRINQFKIRLAFSFLTLLFLLLGLIGRLWYLQILKTEEFQVRATRQHEKTIKLEAKRGKIYDRQGRELALSMEVDSIFAAPKEIKKKKDTAKKISSILQLEFREVNKKLHKRKSFVWLKRKVDPQEADSLKKLNLAGIYFLKESKRFYPKREIASHILGFVGIDNQGLEGIEKLYDRQIKGSPGRGVIEKDALGRQIFSRNKKEDLSSPSDGSSLVLTIDEVIQYYAERELERAFQDYKAKSGTVIIMIPQTGEILALANRPTYDPNKFQEFRPAFWRNRAITDSFEPGSTFKIVTAAGALEEGLVKKNDLFYCEKGAWRIGSQVIHDVHEHAWLSFSRVIEESSNIGTVKVGFKVGPKRLYKYIRAFGFGARTGIGLPGEVRGLIRSPKRWTEASLRAIPYGQEVAVTPLQLISAFSLLANRGMLMKPQIIKCIKNSEGEVIRDFKPAPVRRVISISTAEKLTSILTKTVERGTGREAGIPGYKIAGKTGTAQKVDPRERRYSRDKFVSSFVGYFPAEAPRIAILVLIDEPQKIHYGSLVAAPVFKRIAQEVLRYLEIAPEETPSLVLPLEEGGKGEGAS